MQTLADPSCCVNTNEYWKRMVIGEVTPNFELAKPWGLCIHTSAINFEWDPPRLVVCRANLKILLWFRNSKVNFKLRNHESSTRTPNFKLTKLASNEWNLKFTELYACEPHYSCVV